MSRRAWLGSAGVVAAAASAGALVALGPPGPGQRTSSRGAGLATGRARPRDSSFCMASTPPYAPTRRSVSGWHHSAPTTRPTCALQVLSSRYGPTPATAGGPSAPASTPTPTSVARVRQGRACGLAGDSRSALTAAGVTPACWQHRGLRGHPRRGAHMTSPDPDTQRRRTSGPRDRVRGCVLLRRTRSAADRRRPDRRRPNIRGAAS
jgi:hypothetical protein